MNLTDRLKRFHISQYEICLVGLVLLGLALRIVFITFNWPATNSDEGTMGLVALHIAYKGEWPIFFYGQFYMGTIEGYLAAFLFRLFGPSLFLLRFSLLPFYALFLICMYGLTCLLQSKRFALFTTLLFVFGNGGVILLQLRAIGGYPEIEAFAAAICLLVVWLALSMPFEPSTRRVQFLRSGVYGIFGLICGLAMWTDLLILPFVCLGILFLLLFCRREIFSLAGVSLLFGIIIGILPMLIYNLQVPYDQSSLYELLVLQNSSSGPPPPFLAHIVGAFAIGLPSILSYGFTCQQSSFPLFGQVDLACILPEIIWGVGYLVLCAIVVGTALWALWKLWRSQHGASLFSLSWTWEQRQMLIRTCGRLMVIICALGTFLLYLKSPAAATSPGSSSRYLICVIISVPTVLWPLWENLSLLSSSLSLRKTISDLLRASLLILILCVTIYGTYRMAKHDIPTNQKGVQSQTLLEQRLMSLHAKYIYSDYWICDKTTFLTNEKIICSVLGDNLRPGFNRYLPYQKMVDAATDQTYVFVDNSAQANALKQAIAQKKFKTSYQVTHIAGYIIYSPLSTHS